MKKPSSKIREEIAKLQEQLKHAETREAERIGRIALRAGLGEIEIEETELQAAFEELAKRFRGGKPGTSGRKGAGDSSTGSGQSETDASGAASSSAGEA
ncbi:MULTISPECIES: conjugal transfer protein TraC [Rhizobium/Agrobacterium group]|uniref:Conjugal transfer protein TraC n=1 Tax=Agrobacterium genomosp. 2 str. CFBP 5494 TaxID=1183436 RepID=A0A9W5B6Z4_9HYPH|nr:MULTISPECIES: conjugal transfer protein TraC [Rhizobium/Agrobacterium group]OJH53214.1 conjugal transfer protein TraC [Agrobacterium pusense]OJH55830.1 conjugal transfer protein TraC [Agrobacterium pusense]CAD7057752.1 conjugal transfer protein TraC [Rhizobium sp. P007]CUX01749.1 Conjugal transfer protein TraC [Agrobacterium genomosp. 2 str. CFBP 5494]